MIKISSFHQVVLEDGNNKANEFMFGRKKKKTESEITIENKPDIECEALLRFSDC